MNDLRTIEVREYEYDGVLRVASPPLRFAVSREDDGDLHAQGPFDVLLWSDTREGLMKELWDELEFLFNVFVFADPRKLSQGAKRLRDDVRGSFGMDE